MDVPDALARRGVLIVPASWIRSTDKCTLTLSSLPAPAQTMSSKVVLITGCSLGGIGYAMAEEFAGRANTTVYATARTLSSLETLPANVHRHVLDVTSKEGCEKVVEFILAEAGQIDILVNNAGAGAAGPACEFPIEDARSCFDINVSFDPATVDSLR